MRNYFPAGLLTCLLILMSSAPLSAQFAPASSGGAGSQASQLPASGRTGQNGSVNSVQTPVPGLTSSVNTLNSSMVVQGPFAGSVGSSKPFTGKVSLREAIERALE